MTSYSGDFLEFDPSKSESRFLNFNFKTKTSNKNLNGQEKVGRGPYSRTSFQVS